MSIELRGVHKRFAEYKALNNLDLQIHTGEFLALLGPSGSGKTTLLRIIAGLEFPDSGELYADGQNILRVNARERGVGFVFQHYALFRHMTVFENVAFGLRVRKWSLRPRRSQIVERVMQLLKRVQLEEFAKRYPAQLSGGQRQRVALARALAIEPRVLLLDEPFGALDAQVRKELRRWLRRLHEEMKLTSVFVTHDQEEALELADRVVVINQGRIEQMGTPQDIYHRPGTPFVHEFIGSANRVACRIVQHQVWVGDTLVGSDPERHCPDGPALAFVRPQHLLLTAGKKGEGWCCHINHIYAAGSVTRLELESDTLPGTLEAEISNEDMQRLGLTVGIAVLAQPRQLTLFSEGQPQQCYTLNLH